MVERRAEVVARLKALEESAAPLVGFLQNAAAVQELRADKQYNLQMLNDRYQVGLLLFASFLKPFPFLFKIYVIVWWVCFLCFLLLFFFAEIWFNLVLLNLDFLLLKKVSSKVGKNLPPLKIWIVLQVVLLVLVCIQQFLRALNVFSFCFLFSFCWSNDRDILFLHACIHEEYFVSNSARKCIAKFCYL